MLWVQQIYLRCAYKPCKETDSLLKQIPRFETEVSQCCRRLLRSQLIIASGNQALRTLASNPSMTSWSSRMIVERSYSRWCLPKCKNHDPFPTIKAHIISGEMLQSLYPTLDIFHELIKGECTAGAPIILHVSLARDADNSDQNGVVVVGDPPTSSSSSSELRWRRVSPSRLSSRCWRALTHWSSTSSVVVTLVLATTLVLNPLKSLKERIVIVTRIWLVMRMSRFRGFRILSTPTRSRTRIFDGKQAMTVRMSYYVRFNAGST